jgi:GDP-4-dehydro-6-deoxy-D-mannose reductase
MVIARRSMCDLPVPENRRALMFSSGPTLPALVPLLQSPLALVNDVALLFPVRSQLRYTIAMRILITGVTGFVGGHLSAALHARRNDTLFGTARGRLASEAAKFSYHACDLANATDVKKLVEEVRPERIYHLAGYASTGRSLKEPDAAWAGNLTATHTLYDAVAAAGLKPRILYVGSGLVYGDTPANGGAFSEASPLQPITPYAASKAAADLLSYQYTRFPGLEIVRVRPFNHIGPGQSTEYAVPNWARQIAAIERGEQPPVLEVGDLRPSRDLTDVRDVVEAYLLLMERGNSGEVYNVASGQPRTMQEVLDRLLGLARVKVEVRQQAKLLRAAENLHHCGDASKLRRLTGWSPRFTLEQTLSDILEFWRRGR